MIYIFLLLFFSTKICSAHPYIPSQNQIFFSYISAEEKTYREKSDDSDQTEHIKYPSNSKSIESSLINKILQITGKNKALASKKAFAIFMDIPYSSDKSFVVSQFFNKNYKELSLYNKILIQNNYNNNSFYFSLFSPYYIKSTTKISSDQYSNTNLIGSGFSIAYSGENSNIDFFKRTKITSCFDAVALYHKTEKRFIVTHQTNFNIIDNSLISLNYSAEIKLEYILNQLNFDNIASLLKKSLTLRNSNEILQQDLPLKNILKIHKNIQTNNITISNSGLINFKEIEAYLSFCISRLKTQEQWNTSYNISIGFNL